MTIRHLRLTAVAALAALPLMACQIAPTSGTTVSAGQTQTAQTVLLGTITGSRAVTVEANQGGVGQVLGTVAGGVAGAALGQQVGGGTGKVVATGVGATAGAAIGNQAAAAAQRTESIEWFVQTDGGQNLSVVQASPTFGVGERVQIIQGGGQTRLVPAP
jgi:outer membrane lipoprotein SlyB